MDYSNSCKVDVLALLQQAQSASDGPFFYDLYYVDGIESGSEVSSTPDAQQISQAVPGKPILYPVPVAVLDGPGSTEDFTLVRRFFALDSQLGRLSSSDLVSWIQFPVSATLTIEVRLDLHPSRC
jgi:hypothetical protein